MRVLAQPAFVLHARPWRETSLIVELLTRDHGRVGVVARGVQGPKRHPLRAALQPLQHLRVDYLPQGELGRLLQAEAVDAAPVLQGEALMAAFYVNELVLRLLPRQDPAPGLFERYGCLRAEMGGEGSLAWTLRRFERDLLDELGYGLPWDQDEAGQRLDPAARYRLDPERGPVRDTRHQPDSPSGAALLALAEDRQPPPAQLAELRVALRSVLLAHLGPTPLKSWGLLSDLARLGRE
ncbi:DNA repair protein RecO [Arenimonas fontis]|uniref:DNA repair protein RecO n=1 Tax=Arenimonas fontis TaxID=2608255 RepID=A0A5B2ZEN8_9GAMM|nr:DNA repair protein RecO [Arenimonas fontis]KAA2285532.1 DNA repair protein RecO [Arenimonas fontis]